MALSSCLGLMVCVTFSSSILSHNFPIPFCFQDITLVCSNLCLHVLIRQFIHKS